MRTFFSVGFAPENEIGRAVELQSREIPGYTPETLRNVALTGIPFTGFSTLTLAEGRFLGSLPSGVRLTVARSPSDDLDFDVVVNCIG